MSRGLASECAHAPAHLCEVECALGWVFSKAPQHNALCALAAVLQAAPQHHGVRMQLLCAQESALVTKPDRGSRGARAQREVAFGLVTKPDRGSRDARAQREVAFGLAARLGSSPADPRDVLPPCLAWALP